jgi:hypothetical protein
VVFVGVHSIADNFDFEHSRPFPVVYKFYFDVLGGCGCERSDYDTPKGKELEKAGCDVTLHQWDYDNNQPKSVSIQEKWRRKEKWGYRKRDVWVELRNAYRGGPGWFYKYNKVDYLCFIWQKEQKTYCVLYNNDFFPIVQGLIDRHEVHHYAPHHQRDKQGQVGGETAGCGPLQAQLEFCEVGRREIDGWVTY